MATANKLTDAQDEFIKATAQKGAQLAGRMSHRLVQLGILDNGNELTDAGRAYATERGWLAPQATQADSAQTDGERDAVVMGANIRTVTIPAGDMHEGIYSLSIKLHWVCPNCGRKRNNPVDGVSYDGSRRLHVDTWEACRCGHVDKYSALRSEAATNGLNEPQATQPTASAGVNAVDVFPIGGDSDLVYNALVVLHDIGSPSQERMATNAQEALTKLTDENARLRAQVATLTAERDSLKLVMGIVSEEHKRVSDIMLDAARLAETAMFRSPQSEVRGILAEVISLLRKTAKEAQTDSH